MALPGCNITVGLDGALALIRLTGRAAAEWAPAFEKAVLKLKAGGTERVVLDLSAAILMDSGFSGMLSRLINESGVEFILHKAPQRILDGLEDHGVLALVELMDETGACVPAVAESAYELTPCTKGEVMACCLDAHRALMALKPENVAKFQAVEKYLAQEVAKSSSPAPVAVS